MSGARSLLRRLTPLLAVLALLAPLLAVLALLAPAPAPAASFSPDPPPGSKALKPDPAPSAVVPSKRKVTATVVRHVSPAPVVRTTVVRLQAPVVHSSPVVKQAPPAHHAKRKVAAPEPKARPKPKPTVVVPSLPPVLVPRFIEAPLSADPPRALAALALALAALTALSGAGVVFSWSRR